MTSGIAITGLGAVHAPALDCLPDAVRARAGRAERVTQLALCAANGALTMAGLAVTEGDPRPRMGVVLGTAFGCFVTNAAYQRRLADGGASAASPRLFAATVSNAAAGELAIAYRLGGPAITLTAGGVSGLVAIGHAVDLLRAGQADVLVAGGMDAMHETLGRWIADGGGAREPVREGAVLLVLERREHAASRGARPLGLVGDCSAGFDPQTEGGVAVPAVPFDLPAALEGLGPSDIVVAGRCPTGHLASVELQPVPSVADRQHRGCEEQQHGYAHGVDGDGHGK